MLNKQEKILLVGANLWVLGDGMLGPLFAVFSERIGGNIIDITWAWAVYLGVTGIGIILVGKWSDHIGKEWLLLGGYALTALFTFGYLLVREPIDLLIVQIGLGIALAFSQPTWYALYGRYSHNQDEADGYSWGIATGLSYVIAGGALLIGGFIVSNYSFKVLFITMGCVQILATLYQAKILKYRMKN